MADLIYYSGTMASGKSTLALQTHYNHETKGRIGLIYTRLDRNGQAVVSSRLGISAPAIEVKDDSDIYLEVSNIVGHGGRVDYIICDEVQFYSPAQIEQLARIVDLLGIDIYAFGITTDFRTLLFPGTARLLELADRIIASPVPALCWGVKQATHQGRIVNGEMVMEGATVVVGDTDGHASISYEVLCRRHHMQGLTSIESRN
jgi:thymidine kinase